VGRTRSRIRRRTALVTAGPTSSRSSASARTSDLPLVPALDELGRKDNVAAIMKLAVSGGQKRTPARPAARVRVSNQPARDTRHWLDGLLFAYTAGVAPKNVVTFLRKNGGIASVSP
jgi:hypothetical protein